MTISGVRSALEAALTETPGLSGVPIAWESVNFTTEGTHILAYVLLVEPGPFVALSGTHFAQKGIFSCIVAAPLGRGPRRAEDLAQAIRSRFRTASKWGGCVVIQPPTVSHIGPDGGFYRVSVRIPFQTTMET